MEFSLEETLKRQTLAEISGISKRALKLALPPKAREEELAEFLYGDIREILSALLPDGPGHSRWASLGKRVVQFEEARFVTNYFLRNNHFPQSRSAMVLLGKDPQIACLPWAIPGIAVDFWGYETSLLTYLEGQDRVKQAQEMLGKKSLYLWLNHTLQRKVTLHYLRESCLKTNSFMPNLAVFDLDFCRNMLRLEKDRRRISRLVGDKACNTGPIVLRTTLHVGRCGNSRREIDRQVRDFESLLTENFLIRAKNESPYQSIMPMLSLLWILERKDENECKTVQKALP